MAAESRNSTVTNYTDATLILSERVRNRVIQSAARVDDRREGTSIIEIEPERK